MSKTFLGLGLASLIVMSGSAFADEFYFSNAGNVTWNGVYVNPYTAIDKTTGGTLPANTALTIYCDDWNTEFSGNPTWNASVYELTAGNVANFSKYGITTEIYNVTLETPGGSNPDYLQFAKDTTPIWTPFQRYLEAAYLDSLWETESSSNASQAVKEDIQRKLAAAQWTLFVNDSNVGGLIGAINNTGYADAVNAYLVDAQKAVADGTFTGAGWDVIVPDPKGAMQEFLYHDAPNVPEPSAVILLGTVIGYLGLTKLRRKRPA